MTNTAGIDAYDAELRAQRERRIVLHLGLVKRIARAIQTRLPHHVDAADLVSAGTVGLIRAVDQFDPSRGVAFESFAARCIRGSVLDHLRALDPLPYSTRVRVRAIEKASEALQVRLQRFPLLHELSEATGMSEETVSGVMAQAASASLYSPDEVFANGVLEGALAGQDHSSLLSEVEWNETRELLARFIEELPGSERRVIVLYYYEGLKMKEIASVLDVSESRISQIHARAVVLLRGRLRSALDPPE